jgi:hypothetical protein
VGSRLPARHGKAIELPLVEKAEVFTNPGLVEARGRVVGGGRVYVRTSAKNIRHSAASYILSSVYNPNNGLSQVRYEARPELGTFTTNALFVKEGVVEGSDRRWITPHNPMPCENEALTNVPLSFSYVYRGRGREPAIKDWSNATFVSMVSHLKYENDRYVAKDQVYHRDVPTHVRAFLETQFSEMPVVDLGQLAAYIPTDDDIKYDKKPDTLTPPEDEQPSLAQPSFVKTPSDEHISEETVIMPSPEIGGRPENVDEPGN